LSWAQDPATTSAELPLRFSSRFKSSTISHKGTATSAIAEVSARRHGAHIRMQPKQVAQATHVDMTFPAMIKEQFAFQDVDAQVSRW